MIYQSIYIRYNTITTDNVNENKKIDNSLIFSYTINGPSIKTNNLVLYTGHNYKFIDITSSISFESSDQYTVKHKKEYYNTYYIELNTIENEYIYIKYLVPTELIPNLSLDKSKPLTPPKVYLTTKIPNIIRTNPLQTN